MRVRVCDRCCGLVCSSEAGVSLRERVRLLGCVQQSRPGSATSVWQRAVVDQMIMTHESVRVGWLTRSARAVVGQAAMRERMSW